MFSLDRLNFFIEQTYVIKRFPSVTWDSTDNRIPKRFPPTLNFSGRTITGGVQLSLKK